MTVPVYAEEAEGGEEPAVQKLKISTSEELLAFAENCRLDSYT